MFARLAAAGRRVHHAARSSGRTTLDVVREIVSLRLGPGRLTFGEYFDYGLERSTHSWQAKREFVGYLGQRVIEDIVTDDYSKIVSLDKLSFDAVMRGRGLPVPALLGVYDPSGTRRIPGAALVSDAASLRAFFRQIADTPAYFKPALGGFGRGNHCVEAYDQTTDEVQFAGGDRLALTEFAGRLDKAALLGVMIQEVLRPHPAIQSCCGSRLSGLRIHTLLRKSGPQVFRCIWKVATGHNVIDNFDGGRTGNMVGAVDVQTGRVFRVVAGYQSRGTRHPDTGVELNGFLLPDWSEIVDVVRQASSQFPGLLAQGWDVAITPRGPVLMEVNWLGGVDIPQISYDRGFLDSDFREFLAERNLESLLRGRASENDVNAKTERRGRRKLHWPY